MAAGDRRRLVNALWVFELGRLMTLAILIPLTMLAWWITGGPNGEHAAMFWIVTAVFGVVAIVASNRLPEPWNGYNRDDPRVSRQTQKQNEIAAKSLLAERKARMRPDRVDDAQLLIDSGFVREAEELIRSETEPPRGSG